MKDRPSELSMNEVRSEHATKALPKMILGFRQMSWMHVKKDRGMNMLIRSMAPDVIAVDEIGSKEDVEALFFCAYRGCSILATAHGKNKESLSKNPYMREIINKKMFQRYVILEQRNQPGYIAQIMDENGVVLN